MKPKSRRKVQRGRRVGLQVPEPHALPPRRPMGSYQLGFRRAVSPLDLHTALSGNCGSAGLRSSGSRFQFLCPSGSGSSFRVLPYSLGCRFHRFSGPITELGSTGNLRRCRFPGYVPGPSLGKLIRETDPGNHELLFRRTAPGLRCSTGQPAL